MRFLAVTPVRNGADKIERTIRSVLEQTSLASGRDELRYVVMDGASTDATVAAAKRVGGAKLEIRSEPDAGLYDALAKALALAEREDLVFYLNAGDVLEPTAFQVVATIFSEHPEVRWLTGRATTRNSRHEIVNSQLPQPFRRRLIDCGKYGTTLPVIQQESTFWRGGLHAHVDFAKLATTKLAGDFLLWKSFAQVTELYVVNAVLGSFTQEAGQLSGTKGAYRAELRELRRTPSIAEHVAAFALRQLTRRRVPHRNAKRLFTYDFSRERWMLRGGD